MKYILLLLMLSGHLKANERTFRTLFLNGFKQKMSEYYVYDGENSVKAKFPRMNFSAVYKLKGKGAKIWLVKAPVSDPKLLPKGSPVVTIPGGVKDFYLLLSHDKANSVLPMKMKVVNAGKDKLGRGEMMWFNLTQKPVVGNVGERKLRLPAKKSAMVKEPRRGKGNFVVELYFKVAGDERVHPLTESNWRHDPRCRTLVFVMNNGNRRAPRIKAFSDFRSSVKDKK